MLADKGILTGMGLIVAFPAVFCILFPVNRGILLKVESETLRETCVGLFPRKPPGYATVSNALIIAVKRYPP